MCFLKFYIVYNTKTHYAKKKCVMAWTKMSTPPLDNGCSFTKKSFLSRAPCDQHQKSMSYCLECKHPWYPSPHIFSPTLEMRLL